MRIAIIAGGLTLLCGCLTEHQMEACHKACGGTPRVIEPETCACYPPPETPCGQVSVRLGAEMPPEPPPRTSEPN